jgi:hypothetical protein
MTEKEWVAGGDLKKMLKYLHKRANERKRRLFAVACCRRVWTHLRGPQCHEALETAERYADDLVPASELSEAEEKAHEAYTIARQAGFEASVMASDAVYATTCAGVGWDIAEMAAQRAAAAVAAGAPKGQTRPARVAEVSAQLALLRDVFGNPFRTIAVDPAWRTPDVVALAAGIYEERAFDRMPILADALQDAGCDSDDILNHLRDPHAAHVRGCWALDLILGKS